MAIPSPQERPDLYDYDDSRPEPSRYPPRGSKELDDRMSEIMASLDKPKSRPRIARSLEEAAE